MAGALGGLSVVVLLQFGHCWHLLGAHTGVLVCGVLAPPSCWCAWAAAVVDAAQAASLLLRARLQFKPTRTACQGFGCCHNCGIG